MSSIKYNRDTSIGRRTNISNLSHSTIQSKHTTNSKLYKQPSKLTKSTSSFASSRNLSNNVPKRSSSEIKTKSKYDEKERVIIKKTTGYDDELVQENDTVDYESRYVYDNDFEEFPTEDNKNNTETITEKESNWNTNDINDSQDIDARLEAIQKYLKDTQEEL